ncbi:conserved hypothetical protein [Theileria equi strain WA]|uniref:Uncharacterized protein n=1 Tax=Theileria equi strain WA TaxID=1537102 RepID=L1LAI3_THEEQ|nr:conserved hypothetical protein [Theileria equi strain WA]EKX72487.1 conserved hypothetical protein [Theileria equi strain WA]|eukprot:XP_004831939.1 conserved hypothetical protein [Theileria equi strain WA]
MVRDRLLLENLEDGRPAVWHRNTLSLVSQGEADGLQDSTPTQIVYPNNSLNVGLPVDSINVETKPMVSSDDSVFDDSTGRPLVVYTSTRGEPSGAKKYASLLYLMAIYTLFVLYFGKRMKSHIDFSKNSIIFLKLTRVAIFNYAIVFAGILMGYRSVLRFNSIVTLAFICLKLLYIENIYAVMMSFVQIFVLLSNYHSLYKDTPKVFMISPQPI